LISSSHCILEVTDATSHGTHLTPHKSPTEPPIPPMTPIGLACASRIPADARVVNPFRSITDSDGDDSDAMMHNMANEWIDKT
jgi:hypothetical protein